MSTDLNSNPCTTEGRPTELIRSTSPAAAAASAGFMNVSITAQGGNDPEKFLFRSGRLANGNLHFDPDQLNSCVVMDASMYGESEYISWWPAEGVAVGFLRNQEPIEGVFRLLHFHDLED